MFNAMSDAEIGRQHVELLPSRAVLSMHSAGIGEILGDGPNGTSGSQGGTGKTPGLNLFEWLNHPDTA
jgi:hypothetical protein